MAFIGLLDCNNFFVSCERLFRPDLKGVPVIVLSSNDGCVVARSKEVKEHGVPMGVPYFKVQNELKTMNAAVFSSNFALYRDISSRVMQVLSREADGVEQYSVDEAFFSVPDCSEEELERFASRIKETVEREVGIPVTVGIARTKTLAKCATEIGKRDRGACVLIDSYAKEVMQTFPLREVWGIGGATAGRMSEVGLKTAADLINADPSRVERLFGVHGRRLQLELAEQPVDGRHRSETQQSIMSTRSFKAAVDDVSVLRDAIAYHVGHAAEELRSLGLCAQSINVLIRPGRHGDWALRGGAREALLAVPTDDTRVLLTEATKLLFQMYERGVPYKKAGVVLNRLTPRAQLSSSLFEETDNRILLETVDALNRRFGAGAVAIGRTQSTKRWSPSKTHISPRYTTSWEEIAHVVS